MKTKLEGRQRENKWYTGEKWQTFCAGKGGSPGGPIAIATIAMIIADDLQLRGVDSGAGEAEPAVAAVAAAPAKAAAPPAKAAAAATKAAAAAAAKAGKKPAGKGRSRAAFADRQAATGAVRATLVSEPSPDALPAKRVATPHVPSAMEAAANPEHLRIIHELYGSRAQTLINLLLSFDAYFAWYFPFKKSIPYMCPMPQREARALDNCRRAIDMQEMFERISATSNGHGSFLPHGAVYKVTRDILSVGDVWAHDLSALELQNAESKRVFEAGATKHLEFSSSGLAHKKIGYGEYTLVTTSGYNATAATSTLSKLLATSSLRAGGGMFSTPASRQHERLFGEGGKGRLKVIKHEWADGEERGYDPAEDSCLAAFVRMLAARAEADAE